jgi:hypothetical protein
MIIAGGEVISGDYQIKFKSTIFTTLAHGSSITVDGSSYKVNTVQKIEDGALKVATLSKT